MEDKTIHPEEHFEPISDEYAEQFFDQFEVEKDGNYIFDRIVDHFFEKCVLNLRVKYIVNDQSHIMTVPFGLLKKDVPLELASYIRNKVIEYTRRGKIYHMGKECHNITL